MAGNMLKVNECSVSTGLTEAQLKRVKAAAATYNTDDVTNDYVAATSDILDSLAELYEIVVEDYNGKAEVIQRREAERKAKVEAEAEAKAKATVAPEEFLTTPAEEWDNFLPDTYLEANPYASLDQDLKDAWARVVQSGQVTADRATAIAIESANRRLAQAETETDIFTGGPKKVLAASLKKLSDPTISLEDFGEAIAPVIFHAYFDRDSNTLRAGLPRAALDYLHTKPFSPEQVSIIDMEFLAAANEEPRLEAYFKGTKQAKPWFQYAQSRKMLPNLKITELVGIPLEVAEALVFDGSLKVSQIPRATVKQFSPATLAKVGAEVSTVGTTTTVDVPKQSITKIVNTPAELITRTFEEFMSRATMVMSLDSNFAAEGWTGNVVDYLASLYGKVSEADKNSVYRGRPLRDFFTNGKPNLLLSPKSESYVPVPYKVTPEIQTSVSESYRKEMTAIAEEKKARNELLREERERVTRRTEEDKGTSVKLERDNIARDFDRSDGNFMRDDGTSITSSLPIGRVQMVVKSFLSRLQMRPDTHVYANVADLKARNPELYKQAAAARAAQGDFDSTRAMGYTFGTSPRRVGAPAGVTRRAFMQGVGAVAAAATGKLNLAGLSNTELWQEAFRLNATFGEKTDALWKDAWGMYDKLFPYVSGGQNGDAPGKSALLELTYKINEGPEYSERIGDKLGTSSSLAAQFDSPTFAEFITVEDDGWDAWNAYYPITESQVSEYRDAVEKALAKSEGIYKQAMDLVKSLEGKVPKKAEGKAAAEVKPTVIIFSDYIRTEKQLKFVLAHETMGHFGFRALLSPEELNGVLQRIYNSDADVRAVADAAAVRGMDKLEAVEEYLSDHAAMLDASIIMRIWNKIKDALNKLGIKFSDDEARYFINLARKYVRNGYTGQAFSAERLHADLRSISAQGSDGRFSTVTSMGNLATKSVQMGAMNRQFGNPDAGLMGAMQKFQDRVFGVQQNVPGTVARILEEVQTLDNKARRSEGLHRIYRMMENQQRFARSLLTKYQDMTTTAHGADYKFLDNLNSGIKNVTDEEKEQAGALLAHGALYKREALTDAVFREFGTLVEIDPDTGILTLNSGVLTRLKEFGRVSAAEFRKGIPIKYSIGDPITFKMDVKEDSNVWKIYNEMRNAVDESAIDLLLANFEAAQNETNRMVDRLNNDRSINNIFSKEDLEAIRNAARRYQQIQYAGSSEGASGVTYDRAAYKNAEDFLKAFGRSLFNDEVYKVWMKDPDANPKIVEDLKEFQSAAYDDIRSTMASIRQKITGDEDARKEQSFKVQAVIRDMYLFNSMGRKAQLAAKRTIAGGYVPFVRRGSEQVRMAAYDKDGRPIKLSETIRGTLPYFQVESRAEALKMAEELEEAFKGEWKVLDSDEQEVTVTLRPQVSRSRQSAELTNSINFDEFVYMLNKLNINIVPETRERIVTTLTGQDARARKALARTGTPGWDKDVIRGTSEYLETTAHIAAKKLYKHRVDDILLQTDLWYGSEATLNRYKEDITAATTEGQRARAQREYDRYAYMYQYMAPTGKGQTVEVGGKKVPTLGRGELYRTDAKQLLEFYSSNNNLADSTEDMLSGETGSTLKLATVVMQLGGSIATAVINLGSMATNTLPYLSYYNAETGVGGGYGEAKSAAALFGAMRAVKNYRMGDTAFLRELVKNSKFAEYGLSKDEAEFLLEQSEQGITQAAQFNALVGSARGKAFANKASVQAAIQAWMSMFSYTEQVNRRTTALAAYRLEKERSLAQGVSLKDAVKGATEAAKDAVVRSQGEYAMFNRPEMARGNVLQYVFMYKQFIIMSIQLLKSMPLEGRLMMLGMLFLVSGIKGLPFAEDLMDILDTILQKLGIKQASVEKAASEWLDSVAPGVTPIVMRGVLDRMFSTTVSTRFGMGDLVPVTGAFRAGASPIRELENFAGPAVSAVTGLVGMSAGLTRYTAEVLGIRDDTTSFNSILRDSPIATFRSLADASAYMADGRITNNRGQVISNDTSAWTAVTRMMGFYPAIATQQNDIVRMSKYTGEYAKVIKAEYVGAYVKAKLAGDTGRMREVIADVNAWNDGAEGTGLSISNFARSADRAAREAERPTALRYLKSAPKDLRPETERLLEMYGIPVEELDSP